MGTEHEPTRNDGHGGIDARLHQEDARALDAWFEAEGDLDSVPQPLRPRAQRLAALLGLLGAGPLRGRQERTGKVMAAVGGLALEEPAELSGSDAEALDAWVLAGFDTERVPAALRDRARAHEALAGLVRDSAGPVSSPFERAHLIQRTMDRIEQAAPLGAESDFTIPVRNRLADFLSVAAVLLIAASILWPVMSTVRAGARQAACASNIRGVAHAMGAYTQDNDEMLPMFAAGFGGNTWWNVGRDPRQSNSANLYTLAREQYAPLAELACPGNPQAITAPRSAQARDWSSLEEVSYSYRIMARPERELWGQPSRLVVVSDRSPVVLRAVRGQVVYPLESSPNHRRQGQHVLTADGSAAWIDSPVLESGDNIWLPKPIEMLIDLAARRHGIDPISGTEAPADRQDSFVGP